MAAPTDSMQPTKNIFQVDEKLNASSSWLIAMGVATLIIGFLALSSSVATTLISVIVLGVLCILAAIFQFVFALTSGKWGGFGLHLLLAVLYVLTGIFLVSNPGIGAATLTLFLAFLFITSGIFRIVGSIVMRFSGWGWALLSGVITTALGVYVISNMPVASLTLLGVLLGVDLIFFGAGLMSFGIALRRGPSGHTGGRMTHAYT